MDELSEFLEIHSDKEFSCRLLLMGDIKISISSNLSSFWFRLAFQTVTPRVTEYSCHPNTKSTLQRTKIYDPIGDFKNN